MDLKKLCKVTDSSADYETSAERGEDLVSYAESDPLMQPYQVDAPYQALSDGEYLLVFASERDFWKGDSDAIYDKLKAEGWKYISQSPQDGKYMWDLYRKENPGRAAFEDFKYDDNDLI